MILEQRNVTEDDIYKMSHQEKLAATDFFVFADSHQQQELWAQWHYYPTKNKTKDPSNEEPLVWIQDRAGFVENVGHIKGDKDMPVNISLSFALINGKYICFYEDVSNFVDHSMIDAWVKDKHPRYYQNGQRLAKTNAANFSNCIWFCRKGD